MADLGNAKSTAEIIKKYGFSFRKRYGQNFLIDGHVLEKIVDGALIGEDDGIIEIGPGIGTLTQHLCERAKKVVAIEIDKDLIPILDETMSSYDNVKIVNEDVLKIDMRGLIRDEFGGMDVKVVANLPYYITTPIVMGLLEMRIPVKNITIMIQKEVADRISAGPGTKDYGALSLAVAYYADTYTVANVPQNCFMPRPKVGSTVVRLTVRPHPEVEVKDETMMFSLIRAAFNQRRKTLVNAVANYPGLDFSKKDLTEALETLGLDGAIRGETLDLRQFAALSNILT